MALITVVKFWCVSVCAGGGMVVDGWFGQWDTSTEPHSSPPNEGLGCLWPPVRHPYTCPLHSECNKDSSTPASNATSETDRSVDVGITPHPAALWLFPSVFPSRVSTYFYCQSFCSSFVFLTLLKYCSESQFWGAFLVCIFYSQT